MKTKKLQAVHLPRGLRAFSGLTELGHWATASVLVRLERVSGAPFNRECCTIRGGPTLPATATMDRNRDWQWHLVLEGEDILPHAGSQALA